MVCLRFAVVASPLLSVKASYANIMGICNYYGSPVHFTNTECGGNNCDADANGGNCDAQRAFIPKCEDPTSFDGHHMQVRSDDGRVDLKLWKSDDTGKIRGGGDYATAYDMADEESKGEWNIVINPDASVNLYLTSDPHNCPPPPPQPCTANHVKGHWEYQYMIAAPTTESWTHGTKKSHSESQTETWTNSVTTTVSEGFELAGETSSIQVAYTISHAVSQAYSNEWSENEQQTWEISFGDSAVGKAAWQFKFEETDSCGHVETTLIREYALTSDAATPPCCVPGYTHDAPAYTSCTSQDALVPGVGGCSVGFAVEV